MVGITRSKVIVAEYIFQEHKHSKPLHTQKNTFSKTAVFFVNKILLKQCTKQVHKGYPLAGPCVCNHRLELAFAIRNNLSGSSVFVFSLSFFKIMAEWFSIRIQWRSHQSLSEKRGFARTLSEALGESPDFEFTIAKQTHPLSKQLKFWGGLYYCRCNITMYTCLKVVCVNEMYRLVALSSLF